jgi:cold shock CspA family protein
MNPSQIGTLTRWIEDRGFGFVTPGTGGEEVFIHISAFARGARPAVGMTISFDVETTADGRKRAARARLPGQAQTAAGARSRPRSPQRAHHRSRPRGQSRWIAVLLVAALAVGVGSGSVRDTVARWFRPAQFSEALEAPAARTATIRELPASRPAYQCDGRIHCSQMTSCDEARFFLNTCPGTQMDGDGDGIPCEQQWCGG